MKRVFSILLLIFLFPMYVNASEIYFIGDFVYYDPVTTKACNHTNYWTPYNQNSTCYRFVVLTVDDNIDDGDEEIIPDDSKETESDTIIENILTNPETGQKFTIILFILFISLASIIKYFKKVM